MAVGLLLPLWPWIARVFWFLAPNYANYTNDIGFMPGAAAGRRPPNEFGIALPAE
jgi:hypothetical protein